MFDVNKFLVEARELDEKFKELRAQLAGAVQEDDMYAKVMAVDNTAVRKLLHFPNDISTTRLVSIATKVSKI